MIKTILPINRKGTVQVPASKSQAHRLLICAALAKNKSVLVCDGISKDISATIKCLNALGADIKVENDKIYVSPITSLVKDAHMYCGESGSTLRFMIPIVGAFGVNATFHMEGKLPERPISPLDEVLIAHGMAFNKVNAELHCSGKISGGKFSIPGNVSSQYITGLLFALPMLDSDSTLEVTGKIESSDYILMTEDALKNSGISFVKKENIYSIYGNQCYEVRNEVIVESDWSSAAFMLCAGAFSNEGIKLKNINLSSTQGDKRIVKILEQFGANVETKNDVVTVKKDRLDGITIDASQIPDLVPVICSVASVAKGRTIITNAERLRIKESDRIETTVKMLSNLGA
ncbi:MAG: 3-phosphoshikimate 1-carboxyvinyltransferase, partial [Clostridia bacterium]|nr:3-phosphoshikimate 1-carboxyvinyltransferase [Clostridia bacterium]